MSEPKEVYRAICNVTKALSHEGIAKGKKNEQQGYRFRGIDDIYNALSAVLAGADLCILPRMAERTQEERATAKGGVLFYVTVKGDFDFVSAKDGSVHTVTMYGEAMDSADKATNKAMSAAYKYCCMQVFCIPTEGMDDADATTPQVGKAAAQAVADAKLDKIRQGDAPSNVSVDSDAILEEQRSLHNDIVAYPPKPTKAEKKSTTPFDILGEFRKLKTRFEAIDMRKSYYDVLGSFGVEKSNQFPNTADGLQQARGCWKEMALVLQDLEVKHKQKAMKA